MQEQKKLFNSFVVIAGCGALGQAYAQSFARLGTGNIFIYDPDVFEETNFNRQIFCTSSNIGLSKAEETKKALEKINPDLNYHIFKNHIEDDNFLLSLKNSCIAVDALDNFKSRIYLEKACKELNKPLIHSAINGHTGQMRHISPGDDFLKKNYSKIEDKNIETKNYFSSVMIISSFVSFQVLNFLLGRNEKIRKGLVFFDLENFDFFEEEI